MSNPSFSNIDLWLFELTEGNLSPSQVEQLKTFLLLHPELDVDKDVWENTRLNQSKFVYTKKESLKRDRPVLWFMDLTSAVAVGIGVVLLLIPNGGDQTNSSTQLAKIAEQNSSLKAAAILAPTESASLKNEQAKSKNEKYTTSPLTLDDYAVNGRNIGYPSANQVQGTTQQVVASVNSEEKYNDVIVDTNNASSGEQLPMIAEVPNRTSGVIENLELKPIHSFESPQKETLLTFTGFEATEEKSIKKLEIRRKSVKNSSGYSLSFKHKLSAFTRKVKNMMDNPIALKNYRDPQFSIPGMSVSDVNFSSAGTQLAPRIQTLSRLQWYGEENELLMNQLNVDNYVYAMRGGIGIQMNHAMYRNGGVHVADVALTYSPKISISNTISFEPSLRFKMGHKSLNQDQMNDVTAVEVERGIIRDYYPDGSSPLGKDLWYKDFGAGMMVNTKWFFAGVQLDNLFRHKDNMFNNSIGNPERADRHFVANLGTDWVSRKGNIRLSPYAVYQNKGQLSEVWLGANFGWNKLVIGASYSSNYDPSATIGMKLDRFAMYYNADYSQSRMTGNREISHQITLKFVGKQNHFGNRLIKL